jgi:gluconolactonase
MVNLICSRQYVLISRLTVVLQNRHPAKDEVFFVQNAGAPAAGTGLNKSSIIQKISLSDAEKVRNGTITAAPVTVVNTSNPQVINPNGGTNYKGQIIFAGEGQGDDVASALYIMNPNPPYNTTSRFPKNYSYHLQARF